MPDLDARLRAAVRDGTHAPRTDDVMGRVAAKRAHRRVVRRVQAGVLGVATVLAVTAVSLVALTDGEGETTKIAAPPAPSSTPKVHLVGPDDQRTRAGVHVIALDPDEGYVRGPLLVQGDAVTAAAYDRSGDSYAFPPSRIVRFRLDGKVVDQVDLKGEILSLAEGEGARWAVTRDKDVLAPPDPEFRVKRIGPNGAVDSNEIPRGEQPTGRIFAGGGAVWVPVTDGVLRFDTATGDYAGKVLLTTVAKQRSVASLGKGAYVTDGSALQRLDPATNSADAGSAPAPPGLEYRDIAPGRQGQAWALGADAQGQTFIWEVGHAERVATPDARSFVTARGVIWLELTVDGQPALRRFPEPLRRNLPPTQLRTIRSQNVDDNGAMVPIDARRALVVSHGSIFIAKLRH